MHESPEKQIALGSMPGRVQAGAMPGRVQAGSMPGRVNARKSSKLLSSPPQNFAFFSSSRRKLHCKNLPGIVIVINTGYLI